MGNKANNTEVELKLRVSPEDLEKVFDAFSDSAIGGVIKHKRRPRDYYDTQERELRERNLGLRMQYKSGSDGVLGGYEQTLKSAAGEALPPNADNEDVDADEDMANVFSRKEYKDYTEDEFPQIDAISNKDAKKLMDGITDADLEHVGTSAVERRYFVIEVKYPKSLKNAYEQVKDSKGKKHKQRRVGKVELAFDVGKIKLAPPHDGYQVPVSEIEIEMKDGPPELISKIKKKIMQIAPSAKIETRSKVEIMHELDDERKAHEMAGMSNFYGGNRAPQRHPRYRGRNRRFG